MVKNTKGGNKAKSQARKIVSEDAKTSKHLRISEDELEMYAQVTRNLGNNMCHVLCIDGITRLCHIRGRFRGRNKRHNFIGMLSWVLVGLRDFETEKISSSENIKTKMENCDLLEVYDDAQKERLKNTVKINWNAFVSNDQRFISEKSSVKEENTDSDILFENEAITHSKNEYDYLMNTSCKTISIDPISEENNLDEKDFNFDEI